MSGASQRRLTGRTILALVLCLLAVTFAVEAKLAWYLPPHTLGSEVQAAKALPANVPQPILHGLPDHHPILPMLSFALLLTLAIGSLPMAVSYGSAVIYDRSPLSRSSFSPRNFFRPPP